MALRSVGPATRTHDVSDASRARATARERWVEGIIGAVERTAFFDGLAKRLTGLLSRFVRPGPAKDILSGTWMGHPLHPMLTDVTIGAWTSAVVLDLLPSNETDAAADSLIGLGVLSAIPTAVTGLSDLADVQERDIRTVGGAHALGNGSATMLFGASWIMRRLGRRRAGVALSLAGASAATAAAFLGGDLSYRRGIGVDRTAFDDRVPEWTEAMKEAELDDRPKLVRVGRNDLMVCRDGERIVALANRCTHRGGPLHKGAVEDGTVTCPWHRSTFRFDDGAIVAGPATAPQPCYDVRVRDGMIEVRGRWSVPETST